MIAHHGFTNIKRMILRDFVLGQVWNTNGKTLLCFGINPSYATPEKPDPTIKKIISISKHNGYENWIMLNIYPQRATDPNNMHLQKDDSLVQENLLHIKNIVTKFVGCDVLLAYGNLISERKYLEECLKDIISCLKDEYECKIKVIQLTKKNNPVHPLYQSNQSVLVDYSV